VSTLMLEDLGLEARRKLGLNSSRTCACSKSDRPVIMPITEISQKLGSPRTEHHVPIVLWLRTGLL
jgi:hypothetical protein